jgi:hypothetical protein
MVLTLSAPPSSSIASGNGKLPFSLVGSVDDALPYGRAFWKATGVDPEAERAADKAAQEDATAKIKIPDTVTRKNLYKFTFYELMGFKKLGSNFSEPMLKLAYHKAVLMYHPDKQHGNDGFIDELGQEDRTVFLRIQEANRTLSDEKLRRAYDSQVQLCSYLYLTAPCCLVHLIEPTFQQLILTLFFTLFFLPCTPLEPQNDNQPIRLAT